MRHSISEAIANYSGVIPLPKGQSAVLLLSGGQDSTTCLFWAKQFFTDVHALTINYGQRHRIEIEAANKVAQLAEVSSHEVVDVGAILASSSPLVSGAPVGHYSGPAALPGGVEPTFVPGRNALFLVLLANRAAKLGAQDLVIGVCQEDFGGYHDCRLTFITAMERALGLGIQGDKEAFLIHTPLMHLTKSQSVELAGALPGCMSALAHSHTCYDGEYPPNPFNHASILRAKGFQDSSIADPLIMRAISEGKLPNDYPITGLVEGTRFAEEKAWSEAVDKLTHPTPQKKKPATKQSK
jgi:7-cyano-7-deazaguanine synthase